MSNEPSAPLGIKLLPAWLWTLGVIYLPTTFGFLAPCGHCRRVWAAAWLVMPGALPAWLLGSSFRQAGDGLWVMTLAGALTLAALWGLSQGRRLGRRGFFLVLTAAGIANFICALLAYAAVRS